MIVKVLSEFYDKENLSRSYKVGDVVDFADNRAEDIISRGLGEAMIEETESSDDVVDNKTIEIIETESVEDATQEQKKRGRKPTKVSES